MTKAAKIQALVTALVNKFEEKANKVTSWSGTVSDTNYPSEKLVKDSLDNKQDTSAKKTSWSATVSDDNYPSEKLVKDTLDLKENAANKVSTWSSEPTDTHYPTEKLVKDTLDLKLEAADIPTKTSDLTNDGDGTNPFITQHQSLDSKTVTVEKQSTAESGYAATYVVKQNSSQVGVKINIPKDLLLQSASVETVGAEPSSLEAANNLTTGKSYIKLIANTVDGDNAQTPLIIPIDDIFDLQTADESTITLSNGVYSVKANGIDTTQIKDAAVTTDKIAAKNVTTAKIADKAVTATQIDDYTITATQIASSLSSTWLTTSDVDSEIEDYIDSLTTALTPASASSIEGE